RYGIACSAPAFGAARKEAGERVAGTVAVANALAAGWSPDFLSFGQPPGAAGAMFLHARPMAMSAPYAPPVGSVHESADSAYTDSAPPPIQSAQPGSAPSGG